MDLCLCWMQPIARLVYAVSTAGGLSWTPLWKTDSQPTKRPSKELFQLALHSRACASCTSQSPPPELPPNQRPAALFVVASSPPPTLSSLDALDPSPDLLLASPLQEEARNLNSTPYLSLYGAIPARSEASPNIILDLQVRRAVLSSSGSCSSAPLILSLYFKIFLFWPRKVKPARFLVVRPLLQLSFLPPLP